MGSIGMWLWPTSPALDMSELNLWPLIPTWQAWECRYLLYKARLFRDAAATLSHKQATHTSTASASSKAPAYLAPRVEGGGALPEVEVRVEQAEGGLDGDVGEGVDLTVEQQVVRHVVEGLRGELVRELVEVGGL
jgi:hypothetical protein